MVTPLYLRIVKSFYGNTVSFTRMRFLETRIKILNRSASFQATQPHLDWEYLLNPNNADEIQDNIKKRKGVGSLSCVLDLHTRYLATNSESEKLVLWNQLISAAKKIPNKSDQSIVLYGDNPKVVAVHGEKPTWDFPPLQFHEISKRLGLLRTENLGNLTGHRSYYFIGELALLEQALIDYTIDVLTGKGFELISVPDLLHRDLIESCGMETSGERNQVYCLDNSSGKDICLSGTAEMALASHFSGKIIPTHHLPFKVAAVSRCYRAETSNIKEEKGIYRVHLFTKVEMFGVTAGNVASSNELLNEFVNIERELFDSLDLHYQVLDMPLHELGAPAYRKFDIEAWMAGRGVYGEISSASNCTDYQARRLSIRTEDRASQGVAFAHTVNGTACAVPRMLITILEKNQSADGQVAVPQVLRPYCGGMDRLVPRQPALKLHWIKSKTRQNKI